MTCAMAQAISRRPPTARGSGSIPGQSMWDLWWTNNCMGNSEELIGTTEYLTL
jgi:hypothetical protein